MGRICIEFKTLVTNFRKLSLQQYQTIDINQRGHHAILLNKYNEMSTVPSWYLREEDPYVVF